MRITDIRARTVPIAAPIANAYIDFNEMTLSLVAVVTDVVRDGRPVVGYGFNSNGRYGQGSLIRERFARRILDADPAGLTDATGSNLDPHRIWAAMFRNEKPAGHGERSVAIGTLDMAVWDAVAKKPLFRLIAERHGDGPADPRVFVYAAGGYYRPERDLQLLRDEMRGTPTPDRWPPAKNLFSMQDARNLVRYGGMRPDRDWLQFDPALSYGLVEYLRTLEMLRAAGWRPARCIPHGGHQMALNIAAGLRLGGNESYPDLFQPYGGFPDGIDVEAGHVLMPELQGIGFEGKADLYAEMRSLAS